MTPEAFIAKWEASTRNERAASQEFFIDLCHMLDEPTPNSDPDGSGYAFEKGARKSGGGSGWADVWKRGHFAWEFKGKHADLVAAHRQLQNYVLALENPPLLVVSDMRTVVIRTNWTSTVSETHVVSVAELGDVNARRKLKWVLAKPERLRPGKTREALTAEAATRFAELARTLRGRGHDPFAVAHFINRLVFSLFADDVDLLPHGLLDKMLEAARRDPASFAALAGDLFRAMGRKGGRIGFEVVKWFNGGLFDDDAALPLLAPDIRLLREAAGLDWGDIDPSIFGTLFERGLDPENPAARATSERRLSGIHYTDRDTIMKIIEPVVVRPWLAEWAAERARIAAAMERAATARREKRAAAATRAEGEAKAMLGAFLDRLRGFRVLDPACGSGNFLYLALQALKDIEHRVGLEAEALGLQREFSRIGPEVLRGIELNPYAAELARVSVWIGAIQWARRNGTAHPEDPILQSLETIECRDAVLTPDGRAAAWPAAEAIVGNPPFIGDKAMRKALGGEYVEALRKAYAGRVPGGADFVCYWFEKAREAVEGGETQRVGLVSTQSIRKGASRAVLDRIAATGAIYDAWDDEAWSLDGAAVRVSLICFAARGLEAGARLDGAEVARLNADLTAGADDFTTARQLEENQGRCLQGVTKGGAFEVSEATAQTWIEEPSNPNGHRNEDVLRPWVNGEDVAQRPANRWIIDFDDMVERRAASFATPFAHVLRHVRPKRELNSRKMYRERWWWHVERRPGLRAALAPLGRFIATPRVAKHRLFTWLPTAVLPDSRVYAIALDDDTAFGILHSRFHEAWSLVMSSRHGKGNDPTYNNQTCFETFPFPAGLTPDLPAASYAEDPRAVAIAEAARRLVAARDRWLNPPELVEAAPPPVAGMPGRLVARDAKAAAVLKGRTLTRLYNARGTPEGRWLDDLHADLDAAVAAAYGWPADIPEEAALAALLALNRARAG